MTILSRDLRQLTNRPVLDEFGQLASALTGGPLARDTLRFTRAGWHNTTGAPRSTLQRVAYRLEDERLIRLTYPVLDRTTAIEPTETVLLDGVEVFEVRFLPDMNSLEVDRNLSLDRRFCQENWISEVGFTSQLIEPPLAIEVKLTLSDWGDLERFMSCRHSNIRQQGAALVIAFGVCLGGRTHGGRAAGFFVTAAAIDQHILRRAGWSFLRAEELGFSRCHSMPSKMPIMK